MHGPTAALLLPWFRIFSLAKYSLSDSIIPGVRRICMHTGTGLDAHGCASLPMWPVKTLSERPHTGFIAYFYSVLDAERPWLLHPMMI